LLEFANGSFLGFEEDVGGFEEMDLSSMGGVFQLEFLAGGGDAHGHILIPVKFIDVVLHAVMDEPGLEGSSGLDVLQRVNGQQIVAHCEHL
jgi:hypothetical protein